MAYYIFKVLVTTVLIVVISEIAKRSSLYGALLASVPLVSVMAMLWLYIDTKDVAKVSSLSLSVFWLVIPSLALFVSLPLFLKQGLNFYISISLAIGITIACYATLLVILNQVGIKL